MQDFLAFIFVLGVIVFIHELGHLASAKAFGVYCREFAIGMGPKLFSWKGKETLYSLRALPFGGYVAMMGEEGVDADLPIERSIKGIKPWKRLIIIFAGILMNVLLALTIIIGLYLVQKEVVVKPEAIITQVFEDTAAFEVGLQANDQVLSITFSDGTVIKPNDAYQMLEYLSYYHDEMTFVVLRDQTELSFVITPRYDETLDQYRYGIQIPEGTTKSITTFEAIGYGLSDTKNIVVSMFGTLSRLVRGIGLESISGPVGIYQVTAQQASLGFKNLLYLIAILSLNVGIFNALPIPVMDGGRGVLIVIEMITKKPINPKIEQALMVVSVSLLILLMVFVTTQDLFRLF